MTEDMFFDILKEQIRLYPNKDHLLIWCNPVRCPQCPLNKECKSVYNEMKQHEDRIPEHEIFSRQKTNLFLANKLEEYEKIKFIRNL